MELNVDSLTVDIPCPACGQKTQQTIGWLKAQRQFSCACGQAITVDLSQLKQAVVGAQKLLDHFSTHLRNIAKS